jgi:phytoene dehydrogenase-like protein
VTTDAVVVGSGPNGLAAAVTMARAGLAVEVFEGAATPGGGCRTEELTLPGFAHDVCAAVHPLLAASPFFQRVALEGISLKTPEIAFAHPLDGGRAVAVSSLERTAESLGADEVAYRRLFGPLVRDAAALVPSLLEPLPRLPRHPLAIARFGLRGVWPMTMLARRLQTAPARALLAGLAAHAIRPLSASGTGAFGLLLGLLAHAVGWPIIDGGSAGITAALIDDLAARGGELHTGHWVTDLRELPGSGVTMLDVTPRQLLGLAGERLPGRYRGALRRFRYGSGVCKVDWALAGPVPWQADACRATPTIHLGGTFEEIARGESDVAAGRHPDRPFCIAVQPCVLDPARAPQETQTFYAYCHVPAGSTVDMSARIEAQVERFAPGFRELVLARTSASARESERRNPNYVGGDINAGAATLRQTVLRPTVALHPYNTPLPGLYLCSASTPPGGGVHGMCGENAARAALRQL